MGVRDGGYGGRKFFLWLVNKRSHTMLCYIAVGILCFFVGVICGTLWTRYAFMQAFKQGGLGQFFDKNHSRLAQ